MKIVCIVCDAPKPYARSGDPGTDWCDVCARLTRNRGVASDSAFIAPGSTLRFKDQRRLYQEKKGS